MNTKHTPEPWTLHGGFVIQDAEGKDGIAKCFMGKRGELNERANSKRIVACVNNCKGINPEAVPDLLAALRECVIALDMDDKFCDDINARHSAEVNAFYLASCAIAKATQPK